MDETRNTDRRALAETTSSYGESRDRAPHTKLSISLPSDLADVVRAAASENGLSVSSVIAASLRRTLEGAEQARIDAAVEAQNEENLDWANAYLPVAAKLWAGLDW